MKITAQAAGTYPWVLGFVGGYGDAAGFVLAALARATFLQLSKPTGSPRPTMFMHTSPANSIRPLPLTVAKAGFRNVLETRFSPTTVLTQNQPGSMFRMKMRIISKDLRGLLRNASCLNPFRVGRVAVGLWSHKLLRWAVPYFLIVLFLSNLLLTAHMLYAITLATQVTFYSVSVLGLLLRGDRIRRPLSPASSFCLVNLAALFGTLHCFTFQTAGRWNPCGSGLFHGCISRTRAFPRLVQRRSLPSCVCAPSAPCSTNGESLASARSARRDRRPGPRQVCVQIHEAGYRGPSASYA